MLILGKSNDDKGTQLEHIARKMLSTRGYQNITLNAIGAGGAEYDISGEYIMQLVANIRRVKVIGECKARKDTVNMTDWQKFLGKVYLESIKRKQEVTGLFIAASGFNSYVASSYEELREHKENIELIGETDIEDFLRKEYSVTSIQEVVEMLGSFTTRTVTFIELCYYQQVCYWMITFDKGIYTLLDATGQPLQGDMLQDIQYLIELITSQNTFVDLYAEVEAKLRSLQVQKHILSRLMSYNGVINYEDIVENSIFTIDEIKAASKILAEHGWINFLENEVHLSAMNDQGRYEHIVEMLKFWLNGQVQLHILYEGLESQFYDQHIDEQLLDEIMKIQGNLPIPQDRYNDVIRILKLSPNALNRALHPFTFIINHRSAQQLQNNSLIDEADNNMFFKYIIEGLVQDFNTPHLAHYYSAIRGVIELEHRQSITIKNATGVDAIIEARSRHRVYPSNVQGGYIHLIALNSQPEPWEEAETHQRIDIDFEQF